jgi:hypothetical protein
MTKTIKYAKNYLEFKQSNIILNSALHQDNIQTNQTKGDIYNKNAKILNEVEMSNNEKVFNSFKESEYKKLYDLISTVFFYLLRKPLVLKKKLIKFL